MGIHLPPEILQSIVCQVGAISPVPNWDHVTLASLCLASSSLYHFAAPLLYRSLSFCIDAKRNYDLLIDNLLLPEHDMRWKRWVKAVEITGQYFPVGEARKLRVCGGFAKLLERMESDSLDSFSWSACFAPHQVFVDALLKQKKLRSLCVEFPFDGDQSPSRGGQEDTIFKCLTEEHYQCLEKLELRKAWTLGQMSAAAKAIGCVTLKYLTLHMSYFYDWDEETEFTKLPPRSNGQPSKLVSINLSGITFANSHQLIDSYFNPSTLRKLELRDCIGYDSVCLALSNHADAANIEEVVLVSWESNDNISDVIRFVARCKNLKVLCLDLTSFTDRSMLQLIPAVAESRKALEVLSICLRNDHNWHGESLYYHPKYLEVIKTFENLREIGMSYAIHPKDLHMIAPTLPLKVVIADFRFPWMWVEEGRPFMTADVRNLVKALPVSRLGSVILGDNDDSNAPCSFRIRYLDDGDDVKSSDPIVTRMSRGDRKELAKCRLKWLRGDW